jgi:predicted MFS family arabinose efflux permease
VQILVSMPRDIVIGQVLNSVRNFAALFVASAFFAAIFMQVASSRQRSIENNQGQGEETRSRTSSLLLVKPVFFLAVCVEHLSYAFLPQFVHGVTAASGLPSSWASVPFMAYYLCFAMALMPAGRYETRIGPRPLILGGLFLTACGLLALAVMQNFLGILTARCVSGAGQGMLFIGVQSYILANVAAERKTQGASIIVFGFQGGMISGMAIGSLLVTQLMPVGIFILGAIIAALVMLYSALAVPHTAPTTAGQSTSANSWDIWREIGTMLRNAHFCRTILLIGIPAKAVLTGVIFFAMPMILSKAGYAQEDIGQITMIYAGSVILSGVWAARLADRTGKTAGILFWGSTLSAVGLAILAITSGIFGSVPNSPGFMSATILLGVVTIGMAHGLINAPVVTHVTESELTRQLGAGSVAAAYRFLERLGHTLGPIVVGQLFVVAGQTSAIFAWIAAGVTICGLLFIVNARPADSDVLNQGYAR